MHALTVFSFKEVPLDQNCWTQTHCKQTLFHSPHWEARTCSLRQLSKIILEFCRITWQNTREIKLRKKQQHKFLFSQKGERFEETIASKRRVRSWSQGLSFTQQYKEKKEERFHEIMASKERLGPWSQGFSFTQRYEARKVWRKKMASKEGLGPWSQGFSFTQQYGERKVWRKKNGLKRRLRSWSQGFSFTQQYEESKVWTKSGLKTGMQSLARVGFHYGSYCILQCIIHKCITL